MYKKLETAVKNLKKGVPFSSEKFDFLRDNYYLVMEAVTMDGINLFYAGEDSRNNFEIVLQAVKDEPNVLWCASEELKDNKTIVLEAVSRKGSVLSHASQNMKSDYEVVFAACRNDITSFFHSSEDLQIAYDNYHKKNVLHLLEDIIYIEKHGLTYTPMSDIEAIKVKISLNQSLQDSLKNERPAEKKPLFKI